MSGLKYFGTSRSVDTKKYRMYKQKKWKTFFPIFQPQLVNLFNNHFVVIFVPPEPCSKQRQEFHTTNVSYIYFVDLKEHKILPSSTQLKKNSRMLALGPDFILSYEPVRNQGRFVVDKKILVKAFVYSSRLIKDFGEQ